jgi:anti-anti-sigma regulatory factor
MTGSTPNTLAAFRQTGTEERTLWKSGGGSGRVRTIPRSIVVSVSGDCSYDHAVELCYFMGRNWRPMQERLVLDFTQLVSANTDGLHFLVSQLIRLSGQSNGEIYLVQAPMEARSLLVHTWGKPKIHFAESLSQAILG